MLEIKPVSILNEAGAAKLVFHEGKLAALLVCLSDEYESESGHWHLEWGHEGLSGLKVRTFASLTEADIVISRHLGAR